MFMLKVTSQPKPYCIKGMADKKYMHFDYIQPSYTAKFPEDVAKGHIVITVSATDDDEGMNKEIRYSLEPTGII